jgi:ribosome-binding ATPase YchF (GTP1/OBG family)
MTFLTAGEKEARAWPIRRGTKAPQAAGVIHSDLERGFIRAEVVSYEDYVKYEKMEALRAAGRVRSEGRDYVMQEGDVVNFRFNV